MSDIKSHSMPEKRNPPGTLSKHSSKIPKLSNSEEQDAFDKFIEEQHKFIRDVVDPQLEHMREVLAKEEAELEESRKRASTKSAEVRAQQEQFAREVMESMGKP